VEGNVNNIGKSMKMDREDKEFNVHNNEFKK